MLARLGRVIYWTACGAAGLIALLAVAVAVSNGMKLSELAERGRAAQEAAHASPSAGPPTFEELQAVPRERNPFTAELERRERERAKEDLLYASPFILLVAVGVWLVGRATRYVLAGE